MQKRYLGKSRLEVFAGSRSAILALTEAIKACRMSQGVKRTRLVLT